jgi:PPOX class probable F420-dependent enzyme
MPKAPLPDDVSAFLAQPNPAVMATIGPGGPVTVATWYLWVDGRILINLDESRKRVEHLRAEPRVSLTALADDWYTHVSVQGRVVEIFEDEGLADIDRLSRHYTGHAYGKRDRRRVSVWIEVDRWHGWGSMENKDVDHHRR